MIRVTVFIEPLSHAHGTTYLKRRKKKINEKGRGGGVNAGAYLIENNHSNAYPCEADYEDG